MQHTYQLTDMSINPRAGAGARLPAVPNGWGNRL